MGGSKTPKQQVADYFLSIHYGLCHGPVDAVKGIYLGEKAVWEGTSAGEEPLVISKRNLLGGPKDNGGYEGVVHILQGGVSQVLPAWIAQKMGPVERVPGFRGILSMFFAGKGNSGGFYWGSNSPYIRDAWFKIFRSPKGFYPERAIIPRPDGGPDVDVNPAHIIWECATNQEWGSGTEPSMIDVISMRAAADQLFEEGFGLSMIWTGQQAVEEFIGRVLAHIDGTFDINPRTGLYTLNLIRGDYTVEGLPELTPDNFQLKSFSRRSWEETSNEINVTWTNPANEEEENVTYHDLGNISQQGGNIISETIDYTGVRSTSLAMRLAQREAARRGQPLAGLEGVASRIAWDWMPGDVVLLTWPKRNIYRMPIRLGTVDRGSPGSPGITITAIEDVFYLPKNPYTVPPGSGWVDPSVQPFPLTRVQPVSVPFFMLAQDVGPEEAAAVEYPDTYLAVMAASAVSDAFGFQLNTRSVDFTGAPAWEDLGAKGMTPYSTLPQAMVKEMTSVIGAFGAVESGTGISPGVLLWVGTRGAAHEIMMVLSVAANGNLTLQRGCLDTVPRAWAAGAPVWFYTPELAIEDMTNRGDGEQVTYRLQTLTSLGSLPLADAPDVVVTAEARAVLPYRPANVRMVGQVWPGVVAGYAPATQITWSNRNRLLEVDRVYPWDFGNISPEPGATVSIQLRNTDGTLLQQQDDLTGTSANLDLTGVTGATASVRIWAERDGLTSYQFDEHTFDVAGYGMSYGNYYGGA